MDTDQIIKKYKGFSLRKIRESVAEIRKDATLEQRGVITYSRNFTLSLSNYCQNNCMYCYYNHTIPKDDSEPNVILLPTKSIKSFINRAKSYFCKEALIMSGEHPDKFSEVQNELERRNFTNYLSFVEEVCETLIKENLFPHINIGVLEIEELRQLKEKVASMGLMLESTCEDLTEIGGVHENSPTKSPEIRLQYIENAGKLKIPFTTGLLLGIGEKFEDRIKDLVTIRELHDKYDHIQEVIIQNFTPKDTIPYQPKHPITIKDMLKVAGLARILFNNEISVQVPPNLIQGYEVDFIKVGVSDFGGISPFTKDYINPNEHWPQINYLSLICNQAGFTLTERLPIYDKYIQKEEFCPKIIKKIIDNIQINAHN